MVHISCGRLRKVAVMGGGITIAIYDKAIDDAGVCFYKAVVEFLQFRLGFLTSPDVFAYGTSPVLAVLLLK
jgi:hypothetical protein